MSAESRLGLDYQLHLPPDGAQVRPCRSHISETNMSICSNQWR